MATIEVRRALGREVAQRADRCGEQGHRGDDVEDGSAHMAARVPNAEAYGLRSTDWLVDAVIANQVGAIETVRRLAADGYERQLARVADRYHEQLEQHIRWIEQNRSLFG